MLDFVQFCQRRKDEGTGMGIKKGVAELIERATLEQLALILRLIKRLRRWIIYAQGLQELN